LFHEDNPKFDPERSKRLLPVETWTSPSAWSRYWFRENKNVPFKLNMQITIKND
jgi:hypothetical protein